MNIDRRNFYVGYKSRYLSKYILVFSKDRKNSQCHHPLKLHEPKMENVSYINIKQELRITLALMLNVLM